MDNDFSEPIECLDKKFANMDGKIDSFQENKADKSDIRNLTKKF